MDGSVPAFDNEEFYYRHFLPVSTQLRQPCIGSSVEGGEYKYLPFFVVLLFSSHSVGAESQS